jgi:hypothetical protein
MAPETEAGRSEAGLNLLGGSHLSLSRRGKHTTGTTIVLAFWQVSDEVIQTMFGTS